MESRKYFKVVPNLLPKTDPRYQKWYKSLQKRPSPWNKGKTRETDLRVRKISNTFKAKKIDNFYKWREEMKKSGAIRSFYPPLKKSTELAFLIGMTLGDGNISKFTRVERLIISLNSKYPQLVDHVNYLVSSIFEKQATAQKVKGKNCVRISVYQKNISKRLKIPAGNRRWSSTGARSWVWKSKKYLIAYLKGLFEAEGSLSIHLPTSTYNFQFSNKNQALLDNVERGLRLLGFNPEVRSDKIRLRKKKEVESFKSLIRFREYS